MYKNKLLEKDNVWNCLPNADPAAPCKECDEVWQDHSDPNQPVIWTFRHRCYPNHGDHYAYAKIILYGNADDPRRDYYTVILSTTGEHGEYKIITSYNIPANRTEARKLWTKQGAA